MKQGIAVLILFFGFTSPAISAAAETQEKRLPCKRISLLTAPPSSSPEELVEKMNGTTNMRWDSSDKTLFWSFGHQNGNVNMQIQCTGDLPEALLPFQEQFRCSSDGNGLKIWTYHYGPVFEKIALQEDAPADNEKMMGSVHARRELRNQQVRSITPEQAAELVRDKQCVFYTGAGISASAIPTMLQLMKSLGLDQSQSKDAFLAVLPRALQNPETYIETMRPFYKACFESEPTPAHIAIRDMALGKNWGLLTENLDYLHQRSGIYPLNHDSDTWLKSNVTSEDLQKVSVVITVGLARDECGFLGWYKAMHPQGMIIAINMVLPPYLGENDLFLAGDAQVLLPALKAGLAKDKP